MSGIAMYRRRGEPPTNGASKIASGPPEPGDGQEGGWPRERLIAMDSDFVERVERAFETGSERRESAGGARQRVG